MGKRPDCSFCRLPAVTWVNDENDVMPSCIRCKDQWNKDPGFRSDRRAPAKEATDGE